MATGTVLGSWLKGVLLHDQVGVSHALPDLRGGAANVVHIRRAPPPALAARPPGALAAAAAAALPPRGGAAAPLDRARPERGAEALVQGLGDPDLQRAIYEDVIAAGAALFESQPAARALRAKLEVVVAQSCPRWHADSVGVRCLCTYEGAGTLYIPNSAVRRRWALDGAVSVLSVDERAARQAAAWDMLYLKGHSFPGLYGMGAVHKSPEGASAAVPRLLLTMLPLVGLAAAGGSAAAHAAPAACAPPKRAPSAPAPGAAIPSAGLLSPLSPAGVFELEMESAVARAAAAAAAGGDDAAGGAGAPACGCDGCGCGCSGRGADVAAALQELCYHAESGGASGAEAFARKLSLELLRLRGAYALPRSSLDSGSAAGSAGSSRSSSPRSSSCGGGSPGSGPCSTLSGSGSGGGDAGAAVDVEGIARELLAGGYLIQLRDEAAASRGAAAAAASVALGGAAPPGAAAGDGRRPAAPPRDARRCLQQLRHRFIVCLGGGAGCWPAGGDGPASTATHLAAGDGHLEPCYLPEPLIVEPCFREQFLIAHPTPAYQALLDAVPLCFVGTAGRLEAAVGLLSRAMSAAFRGRGLAVPPWRSKAALLSKWAPAALAALADKIRRVSWRQDAGGGGAGGAAAGGGGGGCGGALAKSAPEAYAGGGGGGSGGASPGFGDVGGCGAAGLLDLGRATSALAPLPSDAAPGPRGPPCAGGGGGPTGAPAFAEALHFPRNASSEWRVRSAAGQKARSLLASALKGAGLGGGAWAGADEGRGGTEAAAAPGGGAPQAAAAADPEPEPAAAAPAPAAAAVVKKAAPCDSGWGCITTVRWGALHAPSAHCS
ncbi:MAG: hypothetical protein J3K34DRAFT_519420 [Monoraphidium minutum]|nr:MAG: hypothetical protein J3K34DRAFT_519420 [Monoraphidium minutum]